MNLTTGRFHRLRFESNPFAPRVRYAYCESTPYGVKEFTLYLMSSEIIPLDKHVRRATGNSGRWYLARDTRIIARLRSRSAAAYAESMGERLAERTKDRWLEEQP